MALYMATRVSVVKPQLDTANPFLTLRALEARSTLSRGMRAEDEMGVQRDTQDFRGSVHRTHCIANSGLVGVRCEQGHAEFLRSNG